MTSFAPHVQDQLRLIEARNRQLNALLYVDADGALASARQLDEKQSLGERLGRLAGKTIAVKANINVVGWPISCGSKVLENYLGTYDADIIQRIRAEDGILLGVANCDEFACGSSGEHSAFGPTQNPRAPGRIPGGSSSGSAVCVAAGFTDLALGSDTGGSIRNPASHCGVVGIKPSFGRVSRHGLIDLSMSLDQVGPFAKIVSDAALLLSVIAGPSPNDVTTLPEPIEEYALAAPPARLRLGLCDAFKDLCKDARIYALVEGAAAAFAKATHSRVVTLASPHLRLGVQTYYPLVYTEFYSATRRLDGRKYGLQIEAACGHEVLRRILGGAEISRAEFGGRYYRKALAAKRLIGEDFTRLFAKADVLLSPVTPRLPHKIGESLDPRDEYAYDAFTIPANLAGICAGVVPIGELDGVPVGLQVMAPAFSEKLLCGVLAAVETLHKA